jgi:serine/threonine protein kinase
MPPFYADDPMDTYERILGEDFLVPPNFSKNLVDLIAKLLKKQPNKRLGSAKGGASTIVSHLRCLPCLTELRHAPEELLNTHHGSEKQALTPILYCVSFEQIKHKWFSSMDWESLIAGTIIPPIVPELKSQDDTAYFSAGHDHHDDEVQPYPGWNPDLSPK